MRRHLEILLVEDNPADVWLTRDVLRQGRIPRNIHVVDNGEQAIDFVHRRGAYNSAPRPDLVILDLNLPRRNGLEVLREVKGSPSLRSIVVVVLTTSDAWTDINAAYDLHANCYVTKPGDLDEFTRAIRGIEEFWMRVAALPAAQAMARTPGGAGAGNDDSGRQPGPGSGPGPLCNFPTAAS